MYPKVSHLPRQLARCNAVPSGKHTENHGKSPFFMGRSTMFMAIFNSYVKLPDGTSLYAPIIWEAETCAPRISARPYFRLRMFTTMVVVPAWFPRHHIPQYERNPVYIHIYILYISIHSLSDWWFSTCFQQVLNMFHVQLALGRYPWTNMFQAVGITGRAGAESRSASRR